MANTAHTMYIALSYAAVAIAITGLIGHILWRDRVTKSKLNALSDDLAEDLEEDTDVDGL